MRLKMQYYYKPYEHVNRSDQYETAQLHGFMKFNDQQEFWTEMTNLITVRRDDDYLDTIVKEVRNTREQTTLRKKLAKRRSSRFTSRTTELNTIKTPGTTSSLQQTMTATTTMDISQAAVVDNELKEML